MRRRRRGGDYKEEEVEEEKLARTRGMPRVHGKHSEGLEWRGKERKRRREKET